MDNFQFRIAAPHLPSDLEWLNVSHPPSQEDLHGKILLLSFWSGCCMGRMRATPDLNRLAAKYPNLLVVVGVHGAKFAAERRLDHVRQVVMRSGVDYPVVNDKDLRVWHLFGMPPCSTLVLIDCSGNIAGSVSREAVYGATFEETMDQSIAALIQSCRLDGKCNDMPLEIQLERDKAPQTFLSFPGKVLADEGTGQLFIADSNHNRIVAVNLSDLAVKAVIGQGTPGLADGSYEEAMFYDPQGMALDGRHLYVADAQNHAIRRVDLDAQTVTTMAGTGEQARSFSLGGRGRQTPLNAPWDLAIGKGRLYVAMAGAHQLWRMDITNGDIARHAGSGRNGRIDGPLAQAALAQPLGITTDGKALYFADGDAGAIRMADLDLAGRVETIAGGELTDFGDVDGRGSSVRLQHPRGVAYHEHALYLADAYNNKIKYITLINSQCNWLLGDPEPGHVDGSAAEARFNEPGGVSIAGGKLYIADTNNHVIRVADLATKTVGTLQIGQVVSLVHA